MGNTPRVMVIGLDCAAPRLVFDEWREALPNLSRLASSGISGPLRSTHPPVTVPAWMAMMTGKDPGTLGVYGFRNRKDHSYDGMVIANSESIREKTVWDLLTERQRTSITIGVPMTYPPRPLRGIQVGCFLAPDEQSNYTYPRAIKAEIDRIAGGYIIDVKDFRTDDKQRIADQIFEMTRRRFKVVRELARTRPWDFFMFVEMGVDRIHHGFWRYMDRRHPKYEPGNPYEQLIPDYYRLIDAEIGALLEQLPPDTVVLVVSDHGAKAMLGGICVNELLLEEGLLTLRERPTMPRKLTPDLVDWSRTVAWGEGGYYSRIFMNVKGREPQGVVEPHQYEAVRDQLKMLLEGVTDEQGRNIGTKVYKPEALYRQVNRVAPDLIVYFGDLDWRSVGSIGMGSIWTSENDTGPDDANHDHLGIFILHDPGQPRGREWREDLELYDVAPTVLHHLGITPPADMIGKVVA